MTTREQRRIAGYLSKYLPDSLLLRVGDPRSPFGRKWELPVMLRTLIVGLMAGCKGFRDIEKLSEDLGQGSRRVLQTLRRLPDTTLRSVTCRLLPDQIREVLHVLTYDAWRRKALTPVRFPFHALSMDGKYACLKSGGLYAQARTREDGTSHSLLRTITSTLVTAAAKPCIDAFPVLATTNEMGAFKGAFAEHLRVYGKMVRLFMYDAGAVSLANAQAVVDAARDYLFVINEATPQIHATIRLLLDFKPPAYRSETILRYAKPNHYPQIRQVKEIRLHTVKRTQKGRTLWPHMRTVISTTTTRYIGDNATPETSDTRYYASSMVETALNGEQWLDLITLRWSVETTHQILDTAFEEDDRTVFVDDEIGALNIMIFRRIAYTLLALWRSVTLRSKDKRTTPWNRVMERFRIALLLLTQEQILNLRTKELAVPAAFS